MKILSIFANMFFIVNYVHASVQKSPQTLPTRLQDRNEKESSQNSISRLTDIEGNHKQNHAHHSLHGGLNTFSNKQDDDQLPEGLNAETLEQFKRQSALSNQERIEEQKQEQLNSSIPINADPAYKKGVICPWTIEEDRKAAQENIVRSHASVQAHLKTLKDDGLWPSFSSNEAGSVALTNNQADNNSQAVDDSTLKLCLQYCCCCASKVADSENIS